MTLPRIVQAEACAWCDMPQRGHATRWHPGIGLHGWIPPSKGLIAARIRRRYQIKGMLPTDPHDPAYRGGRP